MVMVMSMTAMAAGDGDGDGDGDGGGDDDGRILRQHQPPPHHAQGSNIPFGQPLTPM